MEHGLRGGLRGKLWVKFVIICRKDTGCFPKTACRRQARSLKAVDFIHTHGTDKRGDGEGARDFVRVRLISPFLRGFLGRSRSSGRDDQGAGIEMLGQEGLALGIGSCRRQVLEEVAQVAVRLQAISLGGLDEGVEGGLRTTSFCGPPQRKP